jgi:allantoinase
MPLNSSPVTTTAKAFEEKLDAGSGQTESLRQLAAHQTGTIRPLHCNCGFWGGIIPGNQKQIEPLIEKGVLGFKAFLVHSGIDEFPNVTEKDLRKAMPTIAKHGLPLLVHCELAGERPNVKIETGNPRSYKFYLESRPRKWEDDAIALIIGLCEEFNCRVHIVHLSSSDSIRQIAKAKQKGLPLTVETGQHYLYFNSEEIADGQTQFKCAPPIREKENQDKLWQALKDGIIDFVATDHSPCLPEMKKLETGDFVKAWGGIASLQFALPVLWTAARKRNCSIADIAKWLSENSSRLPGLDNRKGKIEKGFDADLVVWDAEKRFIITEELIYHKHKITPYLNEELFGVVEQTWLRGEKVYDHGLMELGRGIIIKKSP